jgi:hypothetical protein
MRTLEITTKIRCINYCVYCPQDILIKNYSGNIFMSLDQFKVILSNTPKDVVIDFTGFCEPFLNKLASQMMYYSVNEGYEIQLITTLTGFREKDAEILKGIKFKHVLIHEFEGLIIDKNFEDKVKLLKDSVLTDRFERFNLPAENRFSRAGNLWDIKSRKGEFECGWSGREFYRNVVLPSGDVYLCCMDYSLKNKLGNLFLMNYNELNRQDIIDKTLIEDSEIICRQCEIAKYEN